MTEVTDTGDDHRHPVFVGGGNHLVVTERAAGMDHGRGAGTGHHVEAVTEREERVGRTHGSLRGEWPST